MTPIKQAIGTVFTDWLNWSDLLGAIQPLLNGDWWDKRWDVAWYVDRCAQKGFANTPDSMRECAKRYMAGKRKISAPGTAKRKRDEKMMVDFLKNPPQEIIVTIETLADSPIATQYKNGNEKALNAIVGMVLKSHKFEPACVRALIVKKL